MPSGYGTVQVASYCLNSFLVTKTQLVGLQISPLRNLSVEKVLVVFGWVAVFAFWPVRRKDLKVVLFLWMLGSPGHCLLGGCGIREDGGCGAGVEVRIRRPGP